MEVCRASNFQYQQWYNPYRLVLMSTDQRTVDQGIEVVLDHMSRVDREMTSHAGDSTLRRVRSRGISFSERVMDCFRR